MLDNAKTTASFKYVYFVSKLPNLISVYLYGRYWAEDTFNSRKKLPMACTIIIFTQLLVFLVTIGYFIWSLIDKTKQEKTGILPIDLFIKVVSEQIIMFLCYIYFMGITSRWATKGKEIAIKDHV